MNDRFDLLQERLQRLENVAFSFPTEDKAEAGPEAENGSIPDDDAMQPDPNQEKAIAAIDEAAEAAGKRMKAMVDQLLVSFTADVDKVLQRSAGIVASQMIQLLAQEIEITARHSLRAALAGFGPDAIVPADCPAAVNTLTSAYESGRMSEATAPDASAAPERVWRDSVAPGSSPDRQPSSAGRVLGPTHAREAGLRFFGKLRKLLQRKAKPPKRETKEQTWGILGLN